MTHQQANRAVRRSRRLSAEVQAALARTPIPWEGPDLDRLWLAIDPDGTAFMPPAGEVDVTVVPGSIMAGVYFTPAEVVTEIEEAQADK